MGFLDEEMYGDPQRMGLMRLATGFLGGGGPANAKIGEGLASMMQGHSQDQAAAQARALAQQQMQMHGLQIQGMQSDQDLKRKQIEMANRIKARVMALSQPQAAPFTPQQGPPQPYSWSGGAQAGPSGAAQAAPDWLRPPSPQQPDFAGQYQAPNYAAPPAAPARLPAATQTARNYADDSAAQINMLAQEMQINREEGNHERADVLFKQMKEMQPKYQAGNRKGRDPVTGKVVNINTADNGYERISEFGPAPDMVGTDLGGKYRWDDKDALAPGTTYDKTQTKDSIASNATSRAIAAQVDARKKQELEGAESAFTPSAIVNAAYRYNTDGTLPPMGMGKTGSMGRSAILNKAAELAAIAGIAPEDQRKAQIGNKSDFANLQKAVSYFSTGEGGKSLRSQNVALAHMETMDKAIEALQNGDAKRFNALVQGYAKETGGTAPTDIAAVRSILSKEIVKAVIAGGGGIDEREAVAKLYAEDLSPKVLRSTNARYLDMIRGQKDGLLDQYERTTGRKDGATIFAPKQRDFNSASTVANPVQQAGAPKNMSLADIAATAKASGKTTAQVTAAARAAGYTVEGR